MSCLIHDVVQDEDGIEKKCNKSQDQIIVIETELLLANTESIPSQTRHLLQLAVTSAHTAPVISTST